MTWGRVGLGDRTQPVEQQPADGVAGFDEGEQHDCEQERSEQALERGEGDPAFLAAVRAWSVWTSVCRWSCVFRGVPTAVLVLFGFAGASFEQEEGPEQKDRQADHGGLESVPAMSWRRHDGHDDISGLSPPREAAVRQRRRAAWARAKV